MSYRNPTPEEAEAIKKRWRENNARWRDAATEEQLKKRKESKREYLARLRITESEQKTIDDAHAEALVVEKSQHLILHIEKPLDDNQKGMTRWWLQIRRRYRFAVINASRQLGKSYWATSFACAEALRNPGWQIIYGAPSQKQARGIIKPHIEKIFSGVEERLKPKWVEADSQFVFSNGSTITIIACDEAKAESSAGRAAHLFIIDEAGKIDNLDFIARSIALPMTVNTKGTVLIISTPARSKGSSFKAYCDEAKAHGTYLERDIFDNPRLTDEEIRELCAACGGVDSTEWQREFLVKHVTDENTAVLPEATTDQLKSITITEEYLKATRSAFVDPYVSVMPGWNPSVTGVVWGHFDFRKKRVVIEDNFVLKRTESMALSNELRLRGQRLWGETKPYRSLGPVDDKVLVELSDLGHTFSATPPELVDIDIGKLRHSISHQRGPPLYVHERCTDLLSQFEDATWDDRRRSFSFSPKHFRYQLVTAAIYLRREINERHDPTPKNLAMHPAQGIYIPMESDRKNSPLASAVRKLFSVRRWR